MDERDYKAMNEEVNEILDNPFMMFVKREGIKDMLSLGQSKPLFEYAEQYANQRVIEELEKWRDKWKIEIDTMPETDDFETGQTEGLAKAWYEMRERIKEIKQ